jgi:hypothetical protein
MTNTNPDLYWIALPCAFLFCLLWPCLRMLGCCHKASVKRSRPIATARQQEIRSLLYGGWKVITTTHYNASRYVNTSSHVYTNCNITKSESFVSSQIRDPTCQVLWVWRRRCRCKEVAVRCCGPLLLLACLCFVEFV